ALSAGTGIFVGGNAFSSHSVTLSAFSGGITNGGTIAPPAGGAGSPRAMFRVRRGGAGIFVGGRATSDASVALLTFAGGVRNPGTLPAGSPAPGHATPFASGTGIVVRGSASNDGILVGDATIGGFSGGIGNSGKISAAKTGIAVFGVDSFACRRQTTMSLR